MNWKQIALRKWRGQVLLLSLVAGVCAHFIQETLARLLLVLDHAEAMVWLPGLAFGLVLAGSLSPLEDLLRRYPQRSLRAALFGGGLGALGGLLPPLLVTLAVPGLVAQSTTALALGVGTATAQLALIGAATGFGSGMAAGGRRRVLRRLLAGALFGTLLGLPLTALELLPLSGGWLPMGATALWAMLLALTLFWWEKQFARRWLRLLTAPGEDWVFPLPASRVSLGKNEHNDIPLPYFKEIYPFHCQLNWAGDHFEVYDEDQGGLVLVNYRQAQDQTLKNGDLIKIGTALLQYGEAK